MNKINVDLIPHKTRLGDNFKSTVIFWKVISESQVSFKQYCISHHRFKKKCMLISLK